MSENIESTDEKEKIAKEDIGKRKKPRVNLFQTFTKVWVTVLLVFALIDLQLSYILAFEGKDTIAESLSIAIVTEIIGVVGVYMVRAFFDTANEKRHELQIRKMDEAIEKVEDISNGEYQSDFCENMNSESEGTVESDEEAEG